jgi:nitrogen fixation/metabolism regulation signal transduction histidine kinase
MFAQKLDKNAPHLAPFAWLTLCQSWNVIMLIMIYFIVIDKKFDFIVVYISIVILLFIVNNFLLTRKKYEALKIRYKDEKNKKLKGWGVGLYIILSFLLVMIVMGKLFWVPKTGWH